MAFIVKMMENSDAGCKSGVSLFPTKDEAWAAIETAYSNTLKCIGGDDFPTVEDEDECPENQHWASCDADGAHIQDGLDSYSWELSEDARFCLNEHKIHVCPVCGAKSFSVTAHVTQDWAVDENGDFIRCEEDCVEVTHRPNDDDVWSCCNCDWSGAGREALIDAVPTT